MSLDALKSEEYLIFLCMLKLEKMLKKVKIKDQKKQVHVIYTLKLIK